MLNEELSSSYRLADDRVRNCLERAGLFDRIVVLDQQILTASATAECLGIERCDIAKSIACFSDREPMVIVTRGDLTVDTELIRQKVGSNTVRLARREEIEQIFAFPRSGVSMVALPGGIAVYVDAILEGRSRLFASAGSDRAVFWASCEEIVRVSNATIIR